MCQNLFSQKEVNCHNMTDMSSSRKGIEISIWAHESTKSDDIGTLIWLSPVFQSCADYLTMRSTDSVFNLEIMYWSNRSFNMPPPGIWLFWKLLLKFPPTRAKMLFKCPTLGSIQVIKCPHPRDISQAQKQQKDGGNAFSCRTKSL